jgi:hypothetical protein
LQVQITRLENQLQIIKQEINVKNLRLEELLNEIGMLKETQSLNLKTKQEKDSLIES